MRYFYKQEGRFSLRGGETRSEVFQVPYVKPPQFDFTAAYPDGSDATGRVDLVKLTPKGFKLQDPNPGLLLQIHWQSDGIIKSAKQVPARTEVTTETLRPATGGGGGNLAIAGSLIAIVGGIAAAILNWSKVLELFGLIS